MFSELPKLLDRNFATAYFLPVSIFFVISAVGLEQFGYWPIISARLTGNFLFDATLGIFLAWITGIFLMVLNRDIYRFLEGYGKYNPLRLFEKRAKREFTRKANRLKALDRDFWAKSFTDKLREERDELMEMLAQRYPDEESFVLPTAFGNALRAFEVYPRVMYGFESIDGWSRILAVLPKEFRELIDDAKAQVDWWVNLAVLSFILLVGYWAAFLSKWSSTLAWYSIVLNAVLPLALFAFLNWFFFWRATSAVIGWGDYVKAAFDIYRFTLLESMNIDAPKSRATEKDLWTNFSQAILFRLPRLLPDLKRVTNKSKPRKSKAAK